MEYGVYVYGLVDPRTHRVRYVGKAKHPRSRLSNHQSCGASLVASWIADLSANGLRPELVILDAAETDEEALAKESRWASHFDGLGELLNARHADWQISAPPRARKPLSRGASLFIDARKSRRMSQNHVARLLSAATGVVCRWESGRQKPSRALAREIEALMGVPAGAWDEAA